MQVCIRVITGVTITGVWFELHRYSLETPLAGVIFAGVMITGVMNAGVHKSDYRCDHYRCV